MQKRTASGEQAGMIKAVKLESVFEMGVGTERHRLLVEWHETVGIGYPKDDLATCYPSEKDFLSGKELWPELYALNGQRVWLRLRPDGWKRKKIVGVEPEEPGWIPLCEAVGWELEDGRLLLDVPAWDKEMERLQAC